VPQLTAEQLQQILQSAFPDNKSIQVVALNDQGITVRLVVSEAHSRPGGTVSGPALMTLADSAAWLAVMSLVGDVQLAVTTSLHIDFLRKPPLSNVLAEATVLKLGKALAVVDVFLLSEQTRAVVAKSSVTYSIPPRHSDAVPTTAS